MRKSHRLIIVTICFMMVGCLLFGCSKSTKKSYTNDSLKDELKISEQLAKNWIDAYLNVGGYMELFKYPQIDSDHLAGTVNLGDSYSISFSFDANENVTLISSGSIVFYNGTDVLFNFTDKLPDKDEKSNLKSLIKLSLKNHLFDEKKAEYYEDSWKYAKEYNYYMVNGKLSAPNAFGVIITSEFTALAKTLENGDWNLYSLILDGKELLI